jgi:2-succinyl-6-hydroxy-2,4-cyclohexadiene-1-carboxylate synthase
MAPLTVNGISLNVEVAGTGPPLLLLHGFTGSAATWAGHLPALTRHATTITVDLIGHGGSDVPADPARYTMSHCIADLLAVLDGLEIGHVSVLGYSMGARVALHLALAAPERVAGLMLESSSPGLADESERSARRASDEELAATIERDGVAAFVADWEQLPLFASQNTLPAEARSALRRQRLRNSARGLAHSLRGMGTGTQASLWSRLGQIEAPALLIVGALDEKFCRLGRAMAGALPRARLAVVPGAGHAVHLERPGEFVRLVLGFNDAYQSQ